jgi:hypothetical protein
MEIQPELQGATQGFSSPGESAGQNRGRQIIFPRMISIPLRFIASVSLFACFVPVLRAEPISFPKENPVFTFELPKELKAKFDPPDRLVFNNGSFFLFETKQLDKEAARKSMDAIISVPCEKVQAQRVSKEPASEITGPSGLIVLEAGCTGSFNTGPDLGYRTRVISLDGKRFFQFGFYSSDLSGAVEAIVKSIKPAVATPSPQK